MFTRGVISHLVIAILLSVNQVNGAGLDLGRPITPSDEIKEFWSPGGRSKSGFVLSAYHRDSPVSPHRHTHASARAQHDASVRQTLVFDTASDLIWLQCYPCPDCFYQTAPPFTPSASSSYTSLNCSDATCTAAELAGNQSCTLSQQCGYSYGYGSGETRGVLSTETVAVNQTSGAVLELPGVVFGCSSTSRGFNVTSGVLGMGRTSISFASQLRPQYNDVFSTCLVERGVGAASQVFFGASAIPSGNVSYTPLHSAPGYLQGAFYGVHVTAVKVGSVTVRGIPKSAFALNTSAKSYGTIFDTGTSLAYLDYRAWLPLFNEVDRQTTAVAYMYHYPTESDANVQCYYTAVGDKFPNIEFVFEGGASIVISPYLYLLDEGDGFVCVAIESFHPRTSPNIFGQILMQNQLIIWDRANNQLGVMPTNCLTGKPL